MPPIQEQTRITAAVNKCFLTADIIDENEKILQTDIEELKTKILELAIQGKLVPQDENDEPASVLLERIRAERKTKLGKKYVESYIYKGDDNCYYEMIGSTTKNITDEIPFDIPRGWALCNLTNVSDIVMGSSPDGMSIMSYGNGMEFHQGKIHFGEKYIGISDRSTTNPIKVAQENSILLCVRAPVGEVNITSRKICIGRGLAAIHPYQSIPCEFLFYWMQTYKDYLNSQATGSTFAAITADTVKNIIIPLPPIAEQRRIVDTIEKLYAYIDLIEKGLS